MDKSRIEVSDRIIANYIYEMDEINKAVAIKSANNVTNNCYKILFEYIKISNVNEYRNNNRRPRT
jgi:hypothetical protein